jgi:hypothetical protein
MKRYRIDRSPHSFEYSISIMLIPSATLQAILSELDPSQDPSWTPAYSSFIHTSDPYQWPYSHRRRLSPQRVKALYASLATVGRIPIEFEFDTGSSLTVTPTLEDFAPELADTPIQVYYKPSRFGLQGSALTYYIKCLEETSSNPFTRVTGEEDSAYLITDSGYLDPLKLPSSDPLVSTDFGSDLFHSGPDFLSLFKALFWIHIISSTSWLIWVYCLGGRVLLQLPLLWGLLALVAF